MLTYHSRKNAQQSSKEAEIGQRLVRVPVGILPGRHHGSFAPTEDPRQDRSMMAQEDLKKPLNDTDALLWVLYRMGEATTRQLSVELRWDWGNNKVRTVLTKAKELGWVDSRIQNPGYTFYWSLTELGEQYLMIVY